MSKYAGIYVCFFVLVACADSEEQKQSLTSKRQKESDDSKVTAEKESAFEIGIIENRIIFKGKNIPAWIANESDVEYYKRTGKLDDRVCSEVKKALSELIPLVQRVNTEILLNSFRSRYDGHIDLFLASEGNWVIAKELSQRRPLPKKRVDDFNGRNPSVFLGWRLPATELGPLLEEASKRKEHRTNACSATAPK